MKAATRSKSPAAKKSPPPAGKGHNRAVPALDKAKRLTLFQMMVRIREFEEQVQRSYLEGLSLIHI